MAVIPEGKSGRPLSPYLRAIIRARYRAKKTAQTKKTISRYTFCIHCGETFKTWRSGPTLQRANKAHLICNVCRRANRQAAKVDMLIWRQCLWCFVGYLGVVRRVSSNQQFKFCELCREDRLKKKKQTTARLRAGLGPLPK